MMKSHLNVHGLVLVIGESQRIANLPLEVALALGVHRGNLHILTHGPEAPLRDRLQSAVGDKKCIKTSTITSESAEAVVGCIDSGLTQSDCVVVNSLSDFALDLGWTATYRLLEEAYAIYADKLWKQGESMKTLVFVVNSSLHTASQLSRLQSFLLSLMSSQNASSNNDNSTAGAIALIQVRDNSEGTFSSDVVVAESLTSRISRLRGKVSEHYDLWTVGTSAKNSLLSVISNKSDSIETTNEKESEISNNGNKTSDQSDKESTTMTAPVMSNVHRLVTFDSFDPDLEDESVDDDLDL